MRSDSPDSLSALLEPLAIPRRFRRGALVLHAGAPAGAVYLVRAGHVRTFLIAEDGRETTTALLGPGQLCGIAPLLGRSTYHAFGEALTDVEVWALPADRLLGRLRQDPALARLVLDALSRRLALTEALLRDVALLPVAERIPDVLARLDGSLGGEAPRLRRTTLARLVGAKRETVSRAAGAVQVA